SSSYSAPCGPLAGVPALHLARPPRTARPFGRHYRNSGTEITLSRERAYDQKTDPSQGDAIQTGAPALHRHLRRDQGTDRPSKILANDELRRPLPQSLGNRGVHGIESAKDRPVQRPPRVTFRQGGIICDVVIAKRLIGQRQIGINP